MADTLIRHTRAKLNLSLAVYAPDETGYHPIASDFCQIQYSDTLIIQPQRAKYMTLHCRNRQVPVSEANTLVRAYALIAPDLDHGFRVILHKRIPLGSGLGGGSANAGGFLRAINERYLGYSSDKLRRVAIRVGCDVPFFTLGGSRAWVTGYGECLDALPGLNRQYAVLILPCAVSTAAVYAAYDAAGIYTDTRSDNALQACVYALYPQYHALIALWNRVYAANPLRLTGSGGTVFALFRSYRQARQAYTYARRHTPYWVALTHTL